MAHLVIIMEDVILRTLVDIETFLRIEDAQLITAQEVDIPTAPRETTILVEGVTDTNEPTWASTIELGPNPTEGIVTLKSPGIEILELQLIDARGRVLWTDDTPPTTGRPQCATSGELLPPDYSSGRHLIRETDQTLAYLQ